MQTGAAYDFETFTPHQPIQAQHLRVVKARKPVPKKRRGLSRTGKRNLKIISLSVLFFALICTVLYSQAMVTELSAEIRSQQEFMKMAQSENAYLTTTMEMKTNLKSVEATATAKLGLVKMDPSQIVYVDREADSMIVCEESWWRKLIESAQNGGLSFFKEYRRE